ncbi:dTMP kinase [Bacterioplanoides sp.]|uniref:dTMP kinase n=1 Tax=Bacterioplanoides sp. TaxID=2066072 RepID=UPI003B5BBB91
MSNNTGRFITFEGGEGVGKSTNIQFVSEWLQQQGIRTLITREPGGTEIAEKIRNDLLKAHHNEDMSDLAELLLVFAARAQHLEKVIRPALASGTWVLCDRFTDSTIAYQGYGRGLSKEVIASLKKLVQQGMEPDCTFLLEAPLELGMSRARGRAADAGEQVDRFETEKLEFFQRVQQGFTELAEQQPRFRRIDASQPLTQVQKAIATQMEQLLTTGGLV